MRKCREKTKFVTGAAVCFSAGVLLSYFLPPFVMIIIEAALILAIGIFCLL